MKKVLILILFSLPVISCLGQTSEEYFEKGLARYDIEDYRGAIEDYNKTVEINLQYAEVYAMRGISRILLGQRNGGCLDLSKAGELGYYRAYDLIKDLCN